MIRVTATRILAAIVLATAGLIAATGSFCAAVGAQPGPTRRSGRCTPADKSP
jgi:hypothetical protein